MSAQLLSPPSARTRPTAPGYSVAEIGEGLTGVLSGVAVCAAILPGFLLTVPGLVLVLMPVMAIGALAGLVLVAVLVAAIPLLVGQRLARRVWRARPALRAPRVPSLPRGAHPTPRRPAL